MSNYVCSDLHGMKPLWDKILDYLKPEDTLYCLGDCADRGPDGWAILKDAIQNPQVKLLMGNHERMLGNAMRVYNDCDGGMYSDYYLLCNNGGEGTFQSWLEDGADNEWLFQINRLPWYHVYTRPDSKVIYLTHAGFTPVCDGEYKWEAGTSLIWNRDHFYDPWPDEEDNLYIIHGHTPIIHLMKKLHDISNNQEETINKATLPYWYAEGHKCDIDSGSFHFGCVILLNLDTFEYKRFVVPMGNQLNKSLLK